MGLPSVPTISGATAYSITFNSAIVSGKVTVSGGSTITARGTTWSTTTGATPTGNSYTTDGTGLGTFISLLTGLQQNTKYYYRVYAINSSGIGYGIEYDFTTLVHPASSNDFRLYERTGIFGGSPTPEEQLATIEASIVTENPIDKQD